MHFIDSAAPSRCAPTFTASQHTWTDLAGERQPLHLATRDALLAERRRPYHSVGALGQTQLLKDLRDPLHPRGVAGSRLHPQKSLGVRRGQVTGKLVMQ